MLTDELGKHMVDHHQLGLVLVDLFLVANVHIKHNHSNPETTVMTRAETMERTWVQTPFISLHSQWTREGKCRC